MKTVLITGGNKGIGLALTKAFLELDYKVIAIARDFKDFAYADKVECIEYDLTHAEGIPALIDSLGQIDTLLNNAGVCIRSLMMLTHKKKWTVCSNSISKHR